MPFMNLLKIAATILYGLIGIFGWFELYKIKSNTMTANVISSQLTVSYVRAIVWYHSRGKLQELRSILLTDDLKNEKIIKTRITNMLKHRTSAYILNFNSLNTPIPNLGDWYAKNFDFNEFLNSVFAIVFNNQLSADEKIREITDVMESCQNNTVAKLSHTLEIQDIKK
jgi:hypothetical protein